MLIYHNSRSFLFSFLAVSTCWFLLNWVIIEQLIIMLLQNVKGLVRGPLIFSQTNSRKAFPRFPATNFCFQKQDGSSFLWILPWTGETVFSSFFLVEVDWRLFLEIFSIFDVLYFSSSFAERTSGCLTRWGKSIGLIFLNTFSWTESSQSSLPY